MSPLRVIITPLGALAQLVARNVRNVEVRGSNPLCSTKAESDELLLLDHRVRSKGEDLRTQKFCHLLMGVAFLISTLLTDSSEFD